MKGSLNAAAAADRVDVVYGGKGELEGASERHRGGDDADDEASGRGGESRGGFSDDGAERPAF